MSGAKFEVVKFDGQGNFGLWQTRVKDLLAQQGILKALRPTKPASMDEEDWEELQQRAVGTIRLCLADEVIYHVMHLSSPDEIWRKLESQFMSKSLTTKLYLKQRLYGLKMQDDHDLAQHVNVFNQIVSDLARLDVKIEDEERAMILLCSLPPSYEHMVTTLTYGKETINIEEITAALLAHNQRKQNAGESSQADSLYVKGNRDRGRKPEKTGSGKRNSRSKSRDKKAIHCYKCKEAGHMNEGDMLSISTTQLTDAWILDSGCSYHITPNREWFSTYRPVNSGSVYLGDDRCCNIVGIDDVRIKMHDGSVRTLSGIRHIPDLKKNLISLGTLHNNGFIPKADEDRETIRIVKGALTVMKGKMTAGNIYRLLGSTVASGVHSVESYDNTTKLWHMRLAHLSERGMAELHKRNLLHGVKSCKLDFCKYCVLGKQTKVRFKTAKHTTQGILDYVHSDVWGPSTTSSLGGSRYYVTFIDDFSRKVWVYFLKQKSEVFEKFKLWKAEFLQFCKEHGIQRHFTVRKTPQQNGVAERMNMSLNERARCLRLNAGLPKHFWAEAVNMACYLINRSPRASLAGKVVEEVWTGHDVSFDNLRIFGCPAYVHVPADERSKLDAKSKECIFLGYKKGVKGFKFWDPVAKKVVISRDVIFDEQSMLQQKQDTTVVDFEQFPVEKPETSQPTSGGSTTDDLQDYSLARDRVRQTNIKPPNRLGFEDLVSFALIVSSDDPVTFHDAVTSQENDKWMAAMVEEMESLNHNRTWELVPLPEGKKPIGCKWVYKKKPAVTEKEGEKHTSIRAVLALVASWDLHLEQMDVKTAFLHGDLEEQIYMRQPEGFTQPGNEHLVCRLKKSLYGLKQSPRQWYKRFDSYMIKIGYNRCEYDCCVYVKSLDDGSFIFLLLYVDDMLIAAKNMDDVIGLKTLLSQEFDMKDLGAAKKILGMEICRDRDSRKLRLSQRGYVEKILERFAMSSAKPVSTPLANHFKLSSEQCPKIDKEAEDMAKDMWIQTMQVTWIIEDLRQAEYMAAAEAAKEALWLTGLVKELGVQQGGVQLLCDNQSAIHLAKNQVYRARTKHIDVRFHKIRELVASVEVLFQKKQGNPTHIEVSKGQDIRQGGDLLCMAHKKSCCGVTNYVGWGCGGTAPARTKATAFDNSWLEKGFGKRLDAAVRTERAEAANEAVDSFHNDNSKPVVEKATPTITEKVKVVVEDLDGLNHKADNTDSAAASGHAIVEERDGGTRSFAELETKRGCHGVAEERDMLILKQEENVNSNMELESRDPMLRVENEGLKAQLENEDDMHGSFAMNNQVYVISPILGFQVKADSISTDPMSITEKSKLKDNIFDDIKSEIKEPYSSNGSEFAELELEENMNSNMEMECQDPMPQVENKSPKAHIIGFQVKTDSISTDPMSSTKKIELMDNIIDDKSEMEEPYSSNVLGQGVDEEMGMVEDAPVIQVNEERDMLVEDELVIQATEVKTMIPQVPLMQSSKNEENLENEDEMRDSFALNNHVSEISPISGFQVKSDSVSTGPMLNTETTVLEDNIVDDNIKSEMVEPCSSNGSGHGVVKVRDMLVENKPVIQTIEVETMIPELPLIGQHFQISKLQENVNSNMKMEGQDATPQVANEGSKAQLENEDDMYGSYAMNNQDDIVNNNIKSEMVEPYSSNGSGYGVVEEKDMLVEDEPVIQALESQDRKLEAESDDLVTRLENEDHEDDTHEKVKNVVDNGGSEIEKDSGLKFKEDSTDCDDASGDGVVDESDMSVEDKHVETEVPEFNHVSGFQVKSDSISNDSMSINEKIELRDNTIDENVKLSQDIKLKMVEPCSSSNVVPNNDESQPMDDDGQPLRNMASVDEIDENNDTTADMNNKDDSEEMGRWFIIRKKGRLMRIRAILPFLLRKEIFKTPQIPKICPRPRNEMVSSRFSTKYKKELCSTFSKASDHSLRVDNFIRPFTLKAVQQLLGKTGTVTSFWMDHIKTHCYVTYSSVEEAIETCNALYNLSSTGFAAFGETASHSTAVTAFGGPDSPVVTLDYLFWKIKATPKIYYLPLLKEQVTAKQATH
ncbi:hypothetical protein F3Y22_tig00110890pilonHSYRG00161 [Hibiscus syriacus]|uniref:Integrase catalytic domain-containing protein n=1 Tax=Hibiscus syriacus TaxID=106335 RepID=A0A6A2ZIS9_HIBSY|nr:hypothetical protein F3Y22_tig00110890pilonHSYRG00161 [Hibiscus syriacus]